MPSPWTLRAAGRADARSFWRAGGDTEAGLGGDAASGCRVRGLVRGGAGARGGSRVRTPWLPIGREGGTGTSSLSQEASAGPPPHSRLRGPTGQGLRRGAAGDRAARPAGAG